MNDCSADHNKIIRRRERETDEKKEGNDQRKKRVYGRTDGRSLGLRDGGTHASAHTSACEGGAKGEREG